MISHFDVTGYILRCGTDVVHLKFPPGKINQPTIDRILSHLQAGFLITEIISDKPKPKP